MWTVPSFEPEIGAVTLPLELLAPEAFEVLPGRSDAEVLISAEHASDRLPEPFRWPPDDAHLVGTHWTYDPGAAEILRELCALIHAPGLLARFSRLLCDPNRPEDAPTLFREVAEGREVALNQALTATEREHRLRTYHRPYHRAFDRMVADSRAAVLLSIHTFTDCYEGDVRTLEVGVLFDQDEELAGTLADVIAGAGFDVRLNEPYSGKDGLMYACDRHARVHGRRAVEVEMRQDLAVHVETRRRLVEALASFDFGPPL